eukprot:11061425-Karenia_brevis.AAC.1
MTPQHGTDSVDGDSSSHRAQRRLDAAFAAADQQAAPIFPLPHAPTSVEVEAREDPYLNSAD